MKPLYCKKHKVRWNPGTFPQCPICKNHTNYYMSDRLKTSLEAKKKAGKLSKYLKAKYDL